MTDIAVRKQPGRRFGPAPKNLPRNGMQAPKPLDDDTRFWHYTDGVRGLTRRQRRQVERMHWRRLAGEYREEARRATG